MGRRIQVMGGSCSGKTTIAGQLAQRLGVPHIELDALHHLPNWQEATAEQFRRRVEEELAGLDSWVVDGNYTHKLGNWLVDQMDTIVWLDLPLRTTLRRMWRRTTTRMKDGTELWGTGNRETWPNFLFKPNGLLLYTLRMHRRRRREIVERIEPSRLVRLRSADEATAWLGRQC